MWLIVWGQTFYSTSEFEANDLSTIPAVQTINNPLNFFIQ